MAPSLARFGFHQDISIGDAAWWSHCHQHPVFAGLLALLPASSNFNMAVLIGDTVSRLAIIGGDEASSPFGLNPVAYARLSTCDVVQLVKNVSCRAVLRFALAFEILPRNLAVAGAAGCTGFGSHLRVVAGYGRVPTGTEAATGARGILLPRRSPFNSVEEVSS